MATLFDNVTVHPVYYERGLLKNNQKKKYVRAPFDMVVINGEPHFRPTSPGGRETEALGLLSSGDLEVLAMWRNDIGYETLEPIVLQEHEMGDGSDSWKGVNAFSNL